MSTQPIMKKYYYKNNELTESNIELAINCFFELYNIKLEYNDRSDFLRCIERLGVDIESILEDYRMIPFLDSMLLHNVNEDLEDTSISIGDEVRIVNEESPFNEMTGVVENIEDDYATVLVNFNEQEGKKVRQDFTLSELESL